MRLLPMMATSLALAAWCVFTPLLFASVSARLPLQDDVTSADLSSSPPGCATKLCLCRGHVTSCNGSGVVTYIPPLPNGTTQASFDRFHLPTVTSHTLANISGLHLEKLSLTNSSITTIDPQALLPFSKLKALSLYGNNIAETELENLFLKITHLPLSMVDLREMNLRNVDGLVGSMSSFHLNTINLDLNQIEEFDFTVCAHDQFLQVLSLHKNSIRKVYLSTLPNLRSLDLGGNRLTDIPAFCPTGDPVFPRLRDLTLNNNLFTSVDRENYHCLSSLEGIDFSYNNVYILPTNTFADMPSLKVVFLVRMGTNFHINSSAFGNPNIVHLYLSKNKFFSPERIHKDAFHGCDGVQHLNFADNDLSQFSSTYLTHLFSPLRTLQSLWMHDCMLVLLPSFLSTLRNLVSLKIANNELVTLERSVLSELKKLKSLDVRYNRLRLGANDLIPRSMQDTLEFIHLMGNLMECTCDILWLKDWIQRNTTHFSDLDKYYCDSPLNKVRLVDFHITKEACLLSGSAQVVILSVCSVLLLVAVVLPLVYRNRWHLEYLLFILRYATARRQRDPREERHFRYDAFVIYDSKDHAWVVNHLMTALEDTQGLRLCLHERDFLAGRLIVDNIVDNISASRKVIAIMSEGSATSEWCQFELSLTHRLTLERGHDLLVVVMLEEVARAHVTRTMYAVLKTTTYIAWPDEERAREAFWN